MLKKARIAVLVSGGGTNLQAIIDAQKNGIIKSAEICLVISNKDGVFALERAASAKIATATILKSDCGSQSAFEEKIVAILAQNDIDIIVLAGFMSILTKEFTSRFPERIINVHPSLIPKFCGKGFYGLKVHEAVLAAAEKTTGATVHFVNEVPDGGRILLQKSVAVCDSDTPLSLQLRVMQEAEWIILPQAIEMVAGEIMENDN